jgi:hypothetical protein
VPKKKQVVKLEPEVDDDEQVRRAPDTVTYTAQVKIENPKAFWGLVLLVGIAIVLALMGRNKDKNAPAIDEEVPLTEVQDQN